jgi:hypothetical protein
MGDKSPKNKTKKQSQKDIAEDRAKGDRKKRQDSFDHGPPKTK